MHRRRMMADTAHLKMHPTAAQPKACLLRVARAAEEGRDFQLVVERLVFHDRLGGRRGSGLVSRLGLPAEQRSKRTLLVLGLRLRSSLRFDRSGIRHRRRARTDDRRRRAQVRRRHVGGGLRDRRRHGSSHRRRRGLGRSNRSGRRSCGFRRDAERCGRRRRVHDRGVQAGLKFTDRLRRRADSSDVLQTCSDH